MVNRILRPLQHHSEDALLTTVAYILGQPGPVTPAQRDDLLAINLELFIREQLDRKIIPIIGIKKGA